VFQSNISPRSCIRSQYYYIIIIYAQLISALFSCSSYKYLALIFFTYSPVGMLGQKSDPHLSRLHAVSTPLAFCLDDINSLLPFPSATHFPFLLSLTLLLFDAYRYTLFRLRHRLAFHHSVFTSRPSYHFTLECSIYYPVSCRLH